MIIEGRTIRTLEELQDFCIAAVAYRKKIVAPCRLPATRLSGWPHCAAQAAENAQAPRMRAGLAAVDRPHQ
jgi:hypothetical protein